MSLCNRAESIIKCPIWPNGDNFHFDPHFHLGLDLAFLLMHSSWEWNVHKLRCCKIDGELWWWCTEDQHLMLCHNEDGTESVKIIQRKIISIIEFSGEKERNAINVKIFSLNSSTCFTSDEIFLHFGKAMKIFYFIPGEFSFLSFCILSDSSACTFEAIWSIWP